MDQMGGLGGEGVHHAPQPGLRYPLDLKEEVVDHKVAPPWGEDIKAWGEAKMLEEGGGHAPPCWSGPIPPEDYADEEGRRLKLENGGVVTAGQQQQGWKFLSCSQCEELGQQASWLLIGCTRVNNQSEARSAS